MDSISGLQRGPQICLNGNDSEQQNHTGTTHRPGDRNTHHAEAKLGKHEWHTHSAFHGATSLRPAAHAAPRTPAFFWGFFARADACLRYFRRPAPICSDAQPVFGRTWGQCFFFLWSISVLSCPRFPLRSPPPRPPPPPPFLPRPPLTVGRGGDDHQASGVRADTHLRLRANQNPGRNLFPYMPGDPLLPRPRGASGKHTL